MGYTHYISRSTRNLDPDTFKSFAAAASKVLSHPSIKDLVSCDFDSTNIPPIVTPDLVRFNGKGDLGHETFSLRRDDWRDFDFCKTAAKPYDKAVVAVLVLAHHYFPNDLEISSDGGPEDWQPGLGLAEEAVGFKVKLPLDNEENS